VELALYDVVGSKCCCGGVELFQVYKGKYACRSRKGYVPEFSRSFGGIAGEGRVFGFCTGYRRNKDDD
jgi:hypothetical protein